VLPATKGPSQPVTAGSRCQQFVSGRLTTTTCACHAKLDSALFTQHKAPVVAHLKCSALALHSRQHKLDLLTTNSAHSVLLMVTCAPSYCNLILLQYIRVRQVNAMVTIRNTYTFPHQVATLLTATRTGRHAAGAVGHMHLRLHTGIRARHDLQSCTAFLPGVEVGAGAPA